jgi:type I restriction enzyme S subunit
MNTYPSYKDSGVEWIGEIPNGWNIVKTKYMTSPRKELSDSGKEELLSVSEYLGVIPRSVIRKGKGSLSRSESLIGYLKVYKGDLVNNIMLMWKKGLGVSQYDGIVSPAYSVFYFIESVPSYYHYLYRTDRYITEFRKNSTGVIMSRLRLYDDDFGDIPSVKPPLQEQQQISDYLDYKTSKIDTLIEKTQQKIELLKEQRTSLINTTVTKGLNPNGELYSF